MGHIFRTLRRLLPFLPASARRFLGVFGVVSSLLAIIDVVALMLLALTLASSVSGTDLVLPVIGTIAAICAGAPEGGPIAGLPLRARFHWLTARRSSIIQTSPVHTGLCTDAAAALEHVMDRMVRPLPAPRG